MNVLWPGTASASCLETRRIYRKTTWEYFFVRHCRIEKGHGPVYIRMRKNCVVCPVHASSTNLGVIIVQSVLVQTGQSGRQLKRMELLGCERGGVEMKTGLQSGLCDNLCCSLNSSAREQVGVFTTMIIYRDWSIITVNPCVLTQCLGIFPSSHLWILVVRSK